MQSRDFEKRNAATQDLSRRFVHGGASFRSRIASGAKNNAEIRGGRPKVDDKKFGRVLAMAPTYVGLERTIRYALLRFAMGSDLITE